MEIRKQLPIEEKIIQQIDKISDDYEMDIELKRQKMCVLSAASNLITNNIDSLQFDEILKNNSLYSIAKKNTFLNEKDKEIINLVNEVREINIKYIKSLPMDSLFTIWSNRLSREPKNGSLILTEDVLGNIPFDIQMFANLKSSCRSYYCFFSTSKNMLAVELIKCIDNGDQYHSSKILEKCNPGILFTPVKLTYKSSPEDKIITPLAYLFERSIEQRIQIKDFASSWFSIAKKYRFIDRQPLWKLFIDTVNNSETMKEKCKLIANEYFIKHIKENPIYSVLENKIKEYLSANNVDDEIKILVNRFDLHLDFDTNILMKWCFIKKCCEPDNTKLLKFADMLMKNLQFIKSEDYLRIEPDLRPPLKWR